MPVDHDRNLLFVHIPKTGGTTILTLLSLWNKERSPDFQKLFGDFGTVDLQHLTLSQTAQFLTPLEFSSYFKFAFIRNPWDRAVSAAQWRRRFREDGVRDLRDFVEWAERVNQRGPERASDVHALPQTAFLSDQDGGTVDAIGRFESFDADLRKILGDRVALPASLPHKLERPDRRSYRDFYTPDLQERIDRLYADDIRRFDYSF